MRRTLAWLALAAATAACGSDPQLDQYGSNPELPEQQRGLPTQPGRFDILVIAATALAMAGWVAAPFQP